MPLSVDTRCTYDSVWVHACRSAYVAPIECRRLRSAMPHVLPLLILKSIFSAPLTVVAFNWVDERCCAQMEGVCRDVDIRMRPTEASIPRPDTLYG